MKKIMLLGLGFLVAMMLITPWATGLIVENKLKSQLLQIQSPRLSVEILNYQRHWFSSDVDIKITYKPSILSPMNQFVLFNQTKRLKVLHGPIILSKNQQGQRRLDLAEALVTLQSAQSKNAASNTDFNFESLLHYTGRSDSIFDGKIEYQQADGKYLKIPQFNGRLALSSSTKSEVGSISIPQIQISNGKGTNLQLNNVSLDTNGERLASYIWLTNNKIHLDSIQINDGTNVLEIKNINLDINYHIDNNILVTQGKLNAESVNYNNQSYGPQILEFHENFNMEIITGMKDLSSTATVDIMKQKLFTLLMSKGMEIGIDKLQILTANGNVSGTFNFKLNPMDEKQVAASKPASLFSNFKNFETQLNLNVSKTLLEKIANWYITDSHNETMTASQLLDEFVKRNLLLIKDSHYELNFNLNKGEVQLNDKQYTDTMEIILLIIEAMNVKSVPTATPTVN